MKRYLLIRVNVFGEASLYMRAETWQELKKEVVKLSAWQEERQARGLPIAWNFVDDYKNDYYIIDNQKKTII